MSLGHGASIVRNGLVLHLDAANTKSYPGSGTTWKDLSNGNNAVLNNSPTFNTSNNGNIVFDGTNDCANTPTIDLSNTSGVTFCAWIKFTKASLMVLAEHSSNFNGPNAFLIDISEYGGAGAFQMSDHGAAGYNIVWTTAGYNDGNWHYFCAVSDRSKGQTDQISLYVDSISNRGGQNYNNDNSGNYSNFPFYIASRNNSQYFTSASIGSVKLYNRALSATEIKQNFEALRGRYGI